MQANKNPGEVAVDRHPGIPSPWILCGLTLAVFLTLLAVFSPSWISFRTWLRLPEVFSSLIEVRRGVSVVLQVGNPFVEITDPIHKIVRWRLLVPGLGHLLHLPPGVVLAFSQVSCLATLGYLIFLGRFSGGLSWTESALLAVVAGAGSWFFTAMGWLGYYDALLALGLLLVAFCPKRWVVAISCLATPWVDERFILALPLAMLVRWIMADMPKSLLAGWLWREALLPALIVAAYVPLRLYLAGQHGSSTVSGFFATVALFGLSPHRILFGIWEGLRVGWIPILAGLAVLYRRRDWTTFLLLLGALLVTCAIGLATANDLSRSMVMLLPAVPLGWILFRRAFPSQKIVSCWVLAVLALILPAHHVVSDFFIPVNGLWVELRQLDNPPPHFAAENYLQQAAAAVRQEDKAAMDNLLAVALRLSPKNAMARNQAAVILASTGRLPEARSLLDEAILLEPSNPGLWRNRSEIRARLGDNKGAELDKRKAASLTEGASK